MSQTTATSYKELQKEAKRRGIPANMKRAFLESAIEAFVEDNHEKLNTIIQYHKSQRKRRANKSAKTSATSTQQHRKQVRKPTDVIATSPLPLQTSTDSFREWFYKPSGDGGGGGRNHDDESDGNEDSRDFRPDSTSTPNHFSSLANLNYHTNDFSSQCVRTNAVRTSHQLPNHITSSSAPTSASLPKIPAQQEMFLDDKNVPSSIYVADRCTVSSVVEQPLAPSHDFSFEFNTDGANFNFARQNYFPVQTAAGYYAETNVNAEIIPVSAICSTPANPLFEHSSSYTMPRLIEKNQRSSSSSLYNQLVNSTSQSNDAKRKISIPEATASCSFNVGPIPAFVDNLRTFPVNSVITSARSIDRARTTGIFGANIANAASVNAEFDSDSDTETLSLTDEIVNLFDSRAENAVLPSFAATSSSTLSIVAKSNPNGSAFNFLNRTVFGESNDQATALRITPDRCGNYESERRSIRDMRVGAAASAMNFVSQPVHRWSNLITLDNIEAAAAGYHSLPSITTLLPEYKTQAYCEETMAIQGSSFDNCAAEDVRCTESLKIKTGIPVEKSIAASTVRQNSKIQRVDVEDNSSTLSYRSCKNNSRGCDVVTTNDEESTAQMHDEECLYRVVRCPADECNWCGVLRTLTDHVYLGHKSDLNVGNDLVFVLDRNERRDDRSVAYFQLHKTSIIAITLRVNEQNCIATMRYLPEIETTATAVADYRNVRLVGTMQLVYFIAGQVETKCWKGVVRPYCEYHRSDTLQSTIGNSKNVIIRVLID